MQGDLSQSYQTFSLHFWSIGLQIIFPNNRAPKDARLNFS